ncbi:MAG: LptE family protein [SAR324 cluster bacterium]|uniref:LptE family protein n=1 Tax=SAR324 cluster bacterium TaxID=2024889 RepID=A0A7X9FU30_9DELT|nr:LptE family protein [SAR324 cluster bacterium]
MINILLGILILLLGGCGYTFHGAGSDLPPDVKRIAIPFVENNSAETGLAAIVTEALRDQFEKYGTLTVVDESEDFDAILNAKILSVSRQTGTVTAQTDTALQLDTILTLSADIKRPNGQLLWQNPRMRISKTVGADKGSVVTSSADFASGPSGAQDLANLSDREIFRGQEQNALEGLAEQAAASIYEDAVIPDF